MWQPSESHDLLLQASLLKGERFHAAWRQWIARVDIDQIDGPSQRLFPLLFANMVEHGVKHAALAVMKRHQLIAWMRNEQLLYASDGVLDALSAGGVDVLLLKGAGLLPQFYRDRGQRPMSDLDIQVHSSALARAQAILEAHGWRSVYESASKTRSVLRITHSCAFLNEQGLEIDLHGHALIQCCVDAFDQEIWSAAERVPLRGRRLLTPCATDHLLLTCLHARATEIFNGVPSIYWAADALAILGHVETPVDFQRLVSLAVRWRLALPLAESLEYLSARLGAPIPARALEELAAVKPSRVERLERASSGLSSPNLRRIVTFLCRYLRLRADPEFAAPLSGLVAYLRYAWNLDPSRQLLPTLGTKVARNILRIGRHYARRSRDKAEG